MRFEEPGMFWEPFKYVKVKTEKSEARPRVMPPIPETGWKPKAIFPDLSRAKAISFDTETCDPDLIEKGPGPRRGAYMVGASIATDDGFKAYYPIAHSMGDNLDKDAVLAYLKRELGRQRQPKVGANLMYDLDFLAEAGVHVEGPFYDVLYADPLIYEYERSYSLDSVAERRIGLRKETSLLYQWCADAYGGPATGEQRKNIWRAPPSLVGPYAEQDAVLPLQVLKEQMKLLREMGSAQVFDMECKLIPLLLKLRRHGVRIDLARCRQLDDELSAKITEAQDRIGINVYAADEIKNFCDANGIIYPRTEKGNPSFTKKWLNDSQHPALMGISELRKLYKMRDTFIRGSLLGSHINGRIHCEFHPLRSDDYGTVSGRFSSSHPNLQQIPKRDEYWGPLIRSCFIPEDGSAWGSLDLSQIEFRLGVHYGKGDHVEPVAKRYRSDPKTDFYKVCQEYSQLPRQESKSIALGTLYGMRYKKFALMTGKSEEEAKSDFDRFNKGLPFMQDTYNHYASEADDFGFVTTIGGRVCHIDPGFSHKALNRKLQGSCADWIKKSMLDAYHAGIFDVLPLSLTVHDETDVSVPPTKAGAEAVKELHHQMCNTYPLNIPVLAGCDFGKSWGALSEVDPSAISAESIEPHVLRL